MGHVVVDADGRIALPEAVREALGVHAGDEVALVRQADGSYALRRAGQSVMRLAGKYTRPGIHVTLEEMDEAIAAGARGE
jgi:AbrB family looped-hinge helix DNA binding protein